MYKNKVAEGIAAFYRTGGQSLPVEVRIQRLNSIMLVAAEESSAKKPKSRRKFNRKHWPPDIIKACKNAKRVFHKWKDTGKKKDSKEYHDLKLAKKEVRRLQRQYEAMGRVNKIEKLMDSEETDTKTKL